ncbi:MAG: tetratricopeptide repeat protein, partial [Pseudonocardiaceae bacterium]
MGTWRASQLLLAVLGLAVLAAVPAVLRVAGVTNVWVLGAAVVVAAVAGAAGWQERYKRVVQRRDEQSWRIEDGCLVLGSGRLPRVREITDPIALGVHPSAPAETVGQGVGQSVPGSRVPPYVPRDVDERLRERLARGGFVILVGHSTAGKSRTAYEAITATLAEHVVIAPDGREALAAAVGKAAQTKRCVLWLNDLEQFLGAGGGLTRTQVSRVLSGAGHHRVIVATLRAVEERRFTEDQQTGEESAVREMMQQVRQTLEQAERIEVGRLFSPAEQDRARVRAWDGRIAQALEHAGEYGIAEYLAAGPELLRDLHNAWEAGANPRGAALVAAAIDCRRAGYLSALPRQLLTELHERYLDQRGGQRLRPESLDDAWAWVTRPRRATTALLAPVSGLPAVQVFDYLVDQAQRRAEPTDQVSDQVITTTLGYATSSDAATIAELAYAQGRYALAAQTLTQAYHARRAEHGEEHPDTLTNRNNLASVLRGLGRLEEAETEHRAVLQIRRRVLGEEHPDTLSNRNNLASVLGDLGRLEEAETEHRAVLQIQQRVLGEEHPATLTSRNNLANVLGDLGRLEEAETEHRAVLQI